LHTHLLLPLLLFALLASACSTEDGLIAPDDSGSIGLWQDGVAVADSPTKDSIHRQPELSTELPTPPPACLDELPQQPAQVFFSKTCAEPALCPCSPADLGEVIGGAIELATAGVDLCVMELQDFSVSGALVKAASNGAQVRTILDDDYADPTEYAVADLLEAGIPVLDDSDGRIMHSKFVVIDGETVIVSSANFSSFDSLSNANNLVVLRSAALAEIFTTRFNQFWNEKSFHNVKNPGPFGASFSGINAEVLWGPHWAPVERLVEAIEGAEEAIHFSIFAFTLEEVKEALLARCGEVELLGVYDGGQAANNDSKAGKGWCASAHVKEANVQPSPGLASDYGFRKLHHKLLIVDPGTNNGLVLTGSTNWSYSAATKNDEVMIILRAPAIVTAFESEFQARFEEAQ
jgi:phosphatidylserine/phosphatidylglycerophosphate/cardiolipin synthase-like enzyme